MKHAHGREDSRTLWFWPSMEGQSMSDEMECMCQECGISSYFRALDLSYESAPGFSGKPLINNLFCPQCGGVLFLVGRIDEEPRYKTG